MIKSIINILCALPPVIITFIAYNWGLRGVIVTTRRKIRHAFRYPSDEALGALILDRHQIRQLKKMVEEFRKTKCESKFTKRLAQYSIKKISPLIGQLDQAICDTEARLDAAGL